MHFTIFFLAFGIASALPTPQSSSEVPDTSSATTDRKLASNWLKEIANENYALYRNANNDFFLLHSDSSTKPAVTARADDPIAPNGNAASQIYGNQATYGDTSPNIGLIQGSLNKPCLGIPVSVNVQAIVGLVNVGLEDIQILSDPQNQECVENSTQVKGDDALNHLLTDIPVLSGNGSGENKVKSREVTEK